MFFLLVVIHRFFFTCVYLEGIGFSFKLLPFSLLSWEGNVDLRYLFYVCALLLLVASILMARIYQKLHDSYTLNKLSIDLGSIKNETERNNIKHLMIAETLYLLGLTYVMHQPSDKVMSFIEKYDIHNFIYLTSLGGFIVSCMCVYLTNDFGIKTMTFHKQKSVNYSHPFNQTVSMF